MKLSQHTVFEIQQPRSPQGLQTPKLPSSPKKLHVRGDILETQQSNAQQKTRSYSIKPEGNCGFNSRSKENKQKKQGTFPKGQKSQKQDKKLSDMSPREITNILRENQQLKEEIMRMQSLIQEVVPVFSKITEDLNDDKVMYKTQDDRQKTQSRNMNSNKIEFSKASKSQKNFEEVTFHEKSQKKPKVYQDLKDQQAIFVELSSKGPLEDSDFMDAENLDMTTLDERQSCGQRIKSSVLTFGQVSNNIIEKQSPRINNKPFNYAMNIKSKLTNLNKQCKNYNMPLPQEDSTMRKSQQAIDFDELARLKTMMHKISSTDILQELRSSQQEDNLVTSESKSRNQDRVVQGTKRISNFTSNDSGFSDEPSIPSDSFRREPIVFNAVPRMQSRSRSPFKKYQVSNMQGKYNDSEKQLNKMPQKHELVYPNQILCLGYQGFNSCESIESSVSDNFSQTMQHHPAHQKHIIQASVSNRIKDSFTPDKKGMSPAKDQQRFNSTLSNQTPILSPIMSNFLVSPQKKEILQNYINPSTSKLIPIKQTVVEESLKKANKTENERFAHQIREVNFDHIGNKDEFSNDNMKVDYFLQSLSRDQFQFSQSVESTEQQLMSKRESVDDMLWMLMKNETPVKAQTQAKNQIVFDDTMRFICKQENDQTQNKRASSGFKRVKSVNRENTSTSPAKTPVRNLFVGFQKHQVSDNNKQQNISPSSDIIVSKVHEESFPSQKILHVQQEERPELDVSERACTTLKKSLCKSKSTKGRLSYSGTSTDHIKGRSRVKSLSQYPYTEQGKRSSIAECKAVLFSLQQETESQQILETESNEKHNNGKKRSPSFCQKWLTIEDMERNLANLNKEIILRTQENNNQQHQAHYDDDKQPQNNLKITQKLCQKKAYDDSVGLIDGSSFQVSQSPQNVNFAMGRPSFPQTERASQSKNRVESPCIMMSPTMQLSKSMKPSPLKTTQVPIETAVIQVDNSPLITLMNTSKTESESGISAMSQIKFAKYSCNIKQQKIQEELQKLDNELEREDQQEKHEHTYLETPSPRILDAKLQTPQFTIEPIKLGPIEEITFKLNDSESINLLQSEQTKREILTSRRVSTADKRDESSSQKSSNMDHIMTDFSSEQQKTTKTGCNFHERINSCSVQSTYLLMGGDLTMNILRVSEVEESPREPEFKMTKKPTLPQIQKEIIDYHPRKTTIIEEESSVYSSIVDIKISPSRDHLKCNILQSENTVIVEQPSDDEEDQSKQLLVVAVDNSIINLMSDENSKISIGEVEMEEGEMFTDKGDQVMTQSDSLIMCKETCPTLKEIEQTSNYNSSRYKTPLRQFINSGLKSYQTQNQQDPKSNLGTNNDSQVKLQKQLNPEAQTEHDQKQMRTSIVSSPKIISPTTEEKQTPQKKAFFISKRDTHNKSGINRDRSATKQEEQTNSENNTSRSLQKSNRDKLNKMRIDYLADKSNTSKNSFVNNENCQSILVPSCNEHIIEPVRTNSRARSNYSSIIQKSANITPSRSKPEKRGMVIRQALSPIQQDASKIRVIPTTTMQNQQEKLRTTTRQSELEIKLKEKEQRVKELVQKKMILDEQRNQIRLLKEQAQTLNTKKINNNQQKLNLSKGVYLRKQSQETLVNQSTTNTNNITHQNHHFSIGSISQTTLNGNNTLGTPTPNSHKQKIVLKKEHIMQSFTSNTTQKKVTIKPEQSTGNNSSIFCTIEALSQTPCQLREPAIHSSVKQLENFLGPLTERSHALNFRDTSSPISGLQPTLRQVEFFKKIEDDCFKRKQKHQSRIDFMSQQAQQRHQNAA